MVGVTVAQMIRDRIDSNQAPVAEEVQRERSAPFEDASLKHSQHPVDEGCYREVGRTVCILKGG